MSKFCGRSPWTQPPFSSMTFLHYWTLVILIFWNVILVVRSNLTPSLKNMITLAKQLTTHLRSSLFSMFLTLFSLISLLLSLFLTLAPPSHTIASSWIRFASPLALSWWHYVHVLLLSHTPSIQCCWFWS